MRLIGLELRLGYQSTGVLEAKLLPCEIELPLSLYGGLVSDITYHTTEGDTTTPRIQLSAPRGNYPNGHPLMRGDDGHLHASDDHSAHRALRAILQNIDPMLVARR